MYIYLMGMKLKRIPAGDYFMGSPDSDEEAWDDEKPRHRIHITRSFDIGVYPVTRGQFGRFVEATMYQTDAESSQPSRWDQSSRYTWRTPGFDQSDDHPVVNVSWNDASAFCHWLSQPEGQQYRLPTEAEWEYACRAESTTRYSFGESDEVLGEYAWYAANSNDRTQPVGEKRPNAFGLHDMHANVWEWCWDGFAWDYYGKSPTIDPRGPDQAERRVVRGGAYYDYTEDVRSAYRSAQWPQSRRPFLAFRVVQAQSED
jgi:formylglycine-generating enzyme required for sulfatase activity